MEEEKKYIYNDKAERIKKMNRFYYRCNHISWNIVFTVSVAPHGKSESGKCNSIWEYCINNRRISFEHDYLS